VAGLAFGAFMDVYQWSFTYGTDPGSYLVVASTSLPYNLAHAIGNVVFCLLIGPVFIRSLRRYRRRFEVHWELPARGGAVAAALLVALALVGGGLAAAPSAEAASASSKAARYLLRAQNRDGGFGAARGQSSSGLMTGWAALGLAAARQHPSYVKRRGGRSITTYLRRTSRRLTDLGELERTILVLRAAGSSPRRFGRRNLVAELLRARRPNGSFRGQASYTSFGILALRAAGRGAGSSADWLARAQNGDGGWGLSPVSGSDTDLTGACLQALAAAGRRGGDTGQDGVRFLRRVQNSDGGFGTARGRSSNSQSTAYAVQGLVAARAGGETVGRALAYLKRRQRRDGSIAYSSSSAQTPVWVTAQALAALRRKAFPLATVPRPRRRAGSSAPSGSSGSAGRSGSGGDADSAAGSRRSRSAAGRAAGRPAGDLAGVSSQTAGASVRVAGDGGPSPAVWGAGLAAALLAVGLGRRRLRRSSP